MTIHPITRSAQACGFSRAQRSLPADECMRPQDWLRVLDALNCYQHNADYMDTKRRLMKHLEHGDQA